MKRFQSFPLHLWLFGVNIVISAFTFGGGYVVVPMIRKYYVLRHKLFTEQELADMAAIAQSSPGAIAINLSVLAGFRTASYIGAIISCLAAILPPLLIFALISAGYEAFSSNQIITAVLRGMQSGAAALMADLAAHSFGALSRETGRWPAVVAAAVFAAHWFLHVHILILIPLCCLLCLYLCRRKRVIQ